MPLAQLFFFTFNILEITALVSLVDSPGSWAYARISTTLISRLNELLFSLQRQYVVLLAEIHLLLTARD